MRAFLVAVLAAAAIAWGSYWVLTTQLGWSTAQRFAAEDSVRLDPAAATRPGF